MRLTTPRTVAARNVAARDAAIRGALGLRTPALALLAGRPLDDTHCAALAANAVAWHVFLLAECCAVPLARALRRAGAWDSLAPDARVAIAAAESRELQRILTARAQLTELDAVAASLGVMPIVLKGGATLAEGTPVDLGDLDLLITDDAADLLARALVTRGYARARVIAAEETLLRAGGLPVELHTSVPYGRVPVPLPADAPATPPIARLGESRALRRLVGAPALMMLLRHGVLHHPIRRGHLRDLVVLAEAIGRCTPAEVDAVTAVCAADPDGSALAETLVLARAIQAGAPTADTPATRRSAAHKYLFALGAWRRVSRVAPRWPTLLFAALDRPAARRASWWAALVSGNDPGSPWACGPLGRAAPHITAALIVPARLAYRATLVVAAMAAGPHARRRIARLVA